MTLAIPLYSDLLKLDNVYFPVNGNVVKLKPFVFLVYTGKFWLSDNFDQDSLMKEIINVGLEITCAYFCTLLRDLTICVFFWCNYLSFEK